jgi:hypothetical protein
LRNRKRRVLNPPGRYQSSGYSDGGT